MTISPSPVTVQLLADHEPLIAAVGQMRWQEWGHPPEPEDEASWVDVTAREAGRDRLPITLEGWAGAHGYERVWVATGGRAVDFYRKYGWKLSETFERAAGEVTTVLTKAL